MDNMLEPEYADAYKTWRTDSSPDNNAMMLKAVQPIMDGAIRTHVGTSNPLLVGSARRLTLEGLRTYDPKRGRLSTHLYNHLQSLKRTNRQQTQILAVPERVALDRSGLDNATQELVHTLGREPTDDELGDHTGLSLRRIKHVRTYRPGVSEGAMQDQATGDAYSGAVLRPQGDMRDAWTELVYADLDPYHQKVMEWTLGMNGQRQLSNQEIARRLNRSPGAVSQAKLRIQQKLDEEADLSPFGSF